jgi:hypothetical protein
MKRTKNEKRVWVEERTVGLIFLSFFANFKHIYNSKHLTNINEENKQEIAKLIHIQNLKKK